MWTCIFFILFFSFLLLLKKERKRKIFKRKKEKRKREIKMHAHTKRCPRPTHAARDQPLHLSPILPCDLLLEDRCRRWCPCSSFPNVSSPSLPSPLLMSPCFLDVPWRHGSGLVHELLSTGRNPSRRSKS